MASKNRKATAAIALSLNFSSEISAQRERATAQFNALKLAADAKTRTILGRAVPVGTVIDRRGYVFEANGNYAEYSKLTFAANSITFGDRTPLLQYHDTSRPVGKLASSKWSDTELSVEFSVSKTAAGDEVLELANDGVLGLSVGIDITGYTLSDDGLLTITEATGREISVTPTPAFEDAVISKVQFTQTREDNEMPNTERFTKHGEEKSTEAGVSEVSLSAESIAAIGAAIAAPTPNAANLALNVQEEAPYRFDGRAGKHEFSTDIFAAAKGDMEAATRVNSYMSEMFAVTQSGVAAVNPAGYRADMYVDHLNNTTPVYSTLYKGGLDNGLAFSFPKFNSQSGLVSDHTEGTEPTGGALTVANGGTVNPTAISGLVEVTREVVDNGGNPQVSKLIRDEIIYRYNQMLEAKAAAFLLGLSGVQTVALTAGATNATLSDLVEDVIAAQHFATGGLRVTDALGHANLFRTLRKARDTSGRLLHPVVNGVNADGSQARDFGSLEVGPLALRPTWSLGAYDAATAQPSFLLNRADVHMWASSPQSITLQPTVALGLRIGIFGYVATAATRADQVIKLTYKVNP